MNEIVTLRHRLLFLERLGRAPTPVEFDAFSTAVQTIGPEAALAAAPTLPPLVTAATPTSVLDEATNIVTLVFPDDITASSTSCQSGILLGNGRLSMETGLAEPSIPTSRAWVASRSGIVTPALNPTDIRIASAASPSARPTAVTQRLMLRTGAVKTSYQLAGGNGSTFHVVHEAMPLQRLPYLTLQTFDVRIEPIPSTPTTIELVHTLSAAADDVGLVDAAFGNSTVNDTAISAPRLLFHGSTRSASAGTTGPRAFVVSTYIPDDLAPPVQDGGYGVRSSLLDRAGRPRAQLLEAEQRLRLAINPSTGTARLNVLTLISTSEDLPGLEQNAPRLFLNLLNARTQSPAALRAEQAAAWSEIWGSGNLYIEPKANLDPADRAAVRNFNKSLALALFEMHSSSRPDNGATTAPIQSLADMLYRLPVLAITKPLAARGLIERHAERLQQARRAVEAGGVAGDLRYYDLSSSSGSTASDVQAPPLLESTLIALGAWHVYRITQDIFWLRTTGIQILRDSADLVSATTVPDASNSARRQLVAQPAIQTSNSTTTVDDSATTSYIAGQAVQAALEASYELSQPVDPRWRANAGPARLTVPYRANFNNNVPHVLLPSADPTAPIASLVDPLVALMPFYRRALLQTIPALATNQAMLDSLSIAKSLRPSSSPPFAASDFLLEAGFHAALAQRATTYAAAVASVNACEAALTAALQAASQPPWGKLARPVASQFIFVVLTCLAGVRISGAVSEVRFKLEELGLIARTGNVLPRAWRKLNVRTSGAVPAGVRTTTSGTKFDVLNRLYTSSGSGNTNLQPVGP